MLLNVTIKKKQQHHLDVKFEEYQNFNQQASYMSFK